MKRWPEFAAASALVATLVGAVIAQDPPAMKDKPTTAAPATTDASSSFAIRNVRVFDGTRTLPRANLVVRDGRIAAVGTDAVFPDGVASIDGRGETPLPGLIDAHSHGWGHAQADLLLVDGDPTTDITATRAIDWVWKNGYAVARTPGP